MSNRYAYETNHPESSVHGTSVHGQIDLDSYTQGYPLVPHAMSVTTYGSAADGCRQRFLGWEG